MAQIRDIIQPLGLFNKRAVAVQRFSLDYTAKEVSAACALCVLSASCVLCARLCALYVLCCLMYLWLVGSRATMQM